MMWPLGKIVEVNYVGVSRPSSIVGVLETLRNSYVSYIFHKK